jgi:hypothetical protein
MIILVAKKATVPAICTMCTLPVGAVDKGCQCHVATKVKKNVLARNKYKI